MPKTEILRRLHGIRCNLYNLGVCQDRCIIGFVMKDGKRFLQIKTAKNDEEGLDFPSDFCLIIRFHRSLYCHKRDNRLGGVPQPEIYKCRLINTVRKIDRQVVNRTEISTAFHMITLPQKDRSIVAHVLATVFEMRK